MSRRGISLLIVVALLGTLAITAGLVALATRVSASASFATLASTQMRLAIESAVARSVVSLLDEDTPWLADGRLYEMEIDDIRMSVRILTEAGRFDLNQGQPETLEALMTELDIPVLDARRIAGALRDWRDSDDEIGENGAEGSAYRAAGRLPPANRPFLAVEEFRNVLGVDRDIYDRLEPYLTVQGAETVNALLAPPALMEAAGLSARDVRRTLAARRDNRPVPQIGEDSNINHDPGWFYAIFIEATGPSGAQSSREVIVSLSSEQDLYETISRHSHAIGYSAFLDAERESE